MTMTTVCCRKCSVLLCCPFHIQSFVSYPPFSMILSVFVPFRLAYACLCRYERVSVRDGTTMTKMSCPGRTRRCKHLQCFDLRSHIQEAYRRRTKWAATGVTCCRVNPMNGVT